MILFLTKSCTTHRKRIVFGNDYIILDIVKTEYYINYIKYAFISVCKPVCSRVSYTFMKHNNIVPKILLDLFETMIIEFNA